MTADNRDNLIPNAQRTPEERTRQARKAGKASGAVRRRKSQMSKSINMILSGKVALADNTKQNLEKIGYDFEANGNPSTLDMIVASIAARALQGDLGAAEFIARYGLIPDMKTVLEMERISAQREAIAQEERAQPQNNLVDVIVGTIAAVNADNIPELLNTAPPPKKEEFQIIDEMREGLCVYFVFDSEIKDHPKKLRINGDTYPVVTPTTPGLPSIGIESPDSFIGKTAKPIGG